MDEFQGSEQEGRQLFIEILNQCNILDYQESLERYDQIDIYYNNHTIGIEVKKRDEKYLNYPSYIMECSKFKGIYQKLKDKEISKAAYVNFIGDNVCYIFPFKRILQAYKNKQIQPQYIYCNCTTVINKGKKEKKIFYLPKQLGIRLERKGDKWIKPIN